MTETRETLIGEPAKALAQRVRQKTVSAAEVIRAHLDHIAQVDHAVGAFQLVRTTKALEEADSLVPADLPLAGVPIAIKDNVAVKGEPMRIGSSATSNQPSASDHEIVRRLRAAGAIVIGKTRVPELCAWAMTDGPFGSTRNPWNAERTAGGSSGGSAAAVAAAMVPVAHGNDGLGSIRIPAACCGVFGMKPGADIVPSNLGGNSWFGMAENGPLTTTVADAALMLSVLAYRPDLRDPTEPDRPLRIAVSTKAPALGVRVDDEFKAAALSMGKMLERAGHHVATADPPYFIKYAVVVLARWCAAVAEDAVGLNRRELESRTRTHLMLGRLARRLGRVSQDDRTRWRGLVGRFFSNYDLLLTPGLARSPLAVDQWSQRSWIVNMWASVSYAPFAAPWNLAGYPAACVPAGTHSDGMPLSIQLVSPDGNEARILSVAKQLEVLRPWRRHAPLGRA